jgi:hypothetical protein
LIPSSIDRNYTYSRVEDRAYNRAPV